MIFSWRLQSQQIGLWSWLGPAADAADDDNDGDDADTASHI